MLEIKDQSTQAQVLLQLWNAIETGQAEALAQMGIPGPAQDLLRELKGFEVVRLLGRNLGFSVTINTNQLIHEVRTLRDQMQHQVDLEFFINRAAPTVLIQRLFRIQRSELAALKRAFPRETKAVAISDRLRSEIEAAWLELRRTHASHSIAHWVALANQFPDSSLATLHNVVASFERLGV